MQCHFRSIGSRQITQHWIRRLSATKVRNWLERVLPRSFMLVSPPRITQSFALHTDHHRTHEAVHLAHIATDSAPAVGLGGVLYGARESNASHLSDTFRGGTKTGSTDRLSRGRRTGGRVRALATWDALRRIGVQEQQHVHELNVCGDTKMAPIPAVIDDPAGLRRSGAAAPPIFPAGFEYIHCAAGLRLTPAARRLLGAVYPSTTPANMWAGCHQTLADEAGAGHVPHHARIARPCLARRLPSPVTVAAFTSAVRFASQGCHISLDSSGGRGRATATLGRHQTFLGGSVSKMS